MTVKQILIDYLKLKGFDGLHSHPENNNYGGCWCSGILLLSCQEYCADCEPAYKHTMKDCKKCPDFEKCDPFDSVEGKKIAYCGKKKV